MYTMENNAPVHPGMCIGSRETRKQAQAFLSSAHHLMLCILAERGKGGGYSRKVVEIFKSLDF